MLPPKITDSTPGEAHQMNLIADLTEEKYLEFAGMCDYCLMASTFIPSNLVSISTAPISIFENANHFLPRSLREAPK